MKTLVTEIFGIVLIILHFSLVPVIILSFFILNRNKNSLHFQKRGIAFLIVHLVVSLVNHAILYPITLWFRFLSGNLIDANNFSSNKLLQKIDEIRIFLTLCGTIAILINIVFRLFYQFIQIHRSKHSLILITIPEINGTTINLPSQNSNMNKFGKLSFILNNYHIFGHASKLCLIEFAIWLCYSIGFALFTFTNVIDNSGALLVLFIIIFGILLIFIFVSVLYLVKKQQVLEFDDHWNIRNEFRHYIAVFFFACMFYVY